MPSTRADHGANKPSQGEGADAELEDDDEPAAARAPMPAPRRPGKAKGMKEVTNDAKEGNKQHTKQERDP